MNQRGEQRQSSRRLTAAADFVVIPKTQRNEGEKGREALGMLEPDIFESSLRMTDKIEQDAMIRMYKEPEREERNI